MVAWSTFGIDPKVMASKPRGVSTRDFALKNAPAWFRDLYAKVGAPKRNGGNALIKEFLFITSPLGSIISRFKPTREWDWPTPVTYRKLSQNFYSVYPYTDFFIQRGLAGKRHNALDIPLPNGQKIRAPHDMRITHAGPYGGYGVTVIGQTGPYTVLLAHNQSVLANAGQNVKLGDVIAVSNNSGSSSGPHSHFEVRKNGVPIDPLKLLSQ